MPTISVFDMTGKEVSTMELSESVFGIEPNAYVMHQAVVAYLANQRQGTQSTLTRTEVAGGGRKPWRQKGTGHARQGSIRAPQWTHGGVALGPKPRSYRLALNKKVKRLALKSAFSSKVLDGDMIVVDKIEAAEFKTKNMVAMLSALGVTRKALVVLPEMDEKVIKSMANIPGVKTAATGVNTYDVVNADKLILSLDAAKKLEEVYA